MVELSERSFSFSPTLGDWRPRAWMNPLRRGPVVLATDGTSRRGAAVVAARLVASRLDLPLEVITVLEPQSVDDAIVREARTHAREVAVSDYVCRFSGGAAPPRIHVRFGDVATEVSRFVHNVSATILILGSAPHRRGQPAGSGERMAELVEAVPCPVLSVPPAFASLPRMVVVVVDSTPASIRAAQAALLMVDHGGTVLLTRPTPPARATSARRARAADVLSDEHALLDRLRDDLARVAPAGVKIETMPLTGSALDGILTSATNADLIAVGTRSADPDARRTAERVVDTVVHDAEQAVLATPNVA